MEMHNAQFLAEQVELSELLLSGQSTMFEPQELPGRYGRVVKALDHVLEVVDCTSVLVGGWAVWRHGYHGRMTQDLDIVLPADRIDEFLRVASVSGFQVIPVQSGRWPKVIHNKTDIKVDILPAGARPGTKSNPAPTTIPHPSEIGGTSTKLRYLPLPFLVELKLAAGRGRDEADVIELMRVNMDQTELVLQHLSTVHRDYVTKFVRLVERAKDQEDE